MQPCPKSHAFSSSLECRLNGARGRIRTCTGDALDVVSLLLDYASLGTTCQSGSSSRCCPGRTSSQKRFTGCCMEEQNWSQSPVPPWAKRAYETCLSAGSIAVLPDSPP